MYSSYELEISVKPTPNYRINPVNPSIGRDSPIEAETRVSNGAAPCRFHVSYSYSAKKEIFFWYDEIRWRAFFANLSHRFMNPIILLCN